MNLFDVGAHCGEKYCETARDSLVVAKCNARIKCEG
jgi:hypothetical protein